MDIYGDIYVHTCVSIGTHTHTEINALDAKN